MSICSLSRSVSIDSFTAHSKLHLNLQINKPPFLEYILQKYSCNVFQADCNKFYCNLTFYKLNTYLILTSAWFGFVEQNVSTDKNFLRNILVTRGDPFVCACPLLRSSRCRQTIVERSSLYFWSPAKQIMRGGRVGLSL